MNKTIECESSQCHTDEENEVFFYDAVEDTAELSSDEESASNSKRSPRLHCLNSKLATLFRKRAHIRNKKVSVEVR